MNDRDYHTAKENNNNQYVMNADRMSMQNAGETLYLFHQVCGIMLLT